VCGVYLCRLDELTPGVARGFDPNRTGGDTLFILRRGNRVLAYLNRCPHQGARLEYRKDHFLSADGQHIVCHAHGAYFDPETGACTRGACLGKTLRSLPCSVHEGRIWVSLAEAVVG
jgi:nitrite reductase/ring-hydroxylating ferredoxin subunit